MILNFTDAQTALRRFYNTPGSNTYTLVRMRELMAYLGNPQDTLRVIHVAGTSGKTSTAYYVSSLLEQSGATVGLTVSPHVNEINERVQVNHSPLPEAEFCRSLDDFLRTVDRSGVSPSYFELMVAFAFWQFVRIGVDYAVVEVGLGGLIDGTNVISREDKVCVITDIGLDHTNVLGKTLPEITKHKAGIIYKNNYVFMHQQSSDVMEEIQQKCVQETANLHIIEAWHVAAPDTLPLFQQRNFALAAEVVRYVLMRDSYPLLTSKKVTAASKIYIPGRMEIHYIHGKTIIIDGAHNAQKMSALVSSIKAAFPNREVATLVAFIHAMPDRWQPTLDALATLSHHFVITSFNVEQDHSLKDSVETEALAGYMRSKRSATLSVEPRLQLACEVLLSQPEPILLVTGSLYMLSSARRLLGIKACS